MEKDGFIFKSSYYEAIKNLPRDIQGEIYTAIMEYGLYGNETESLKPVARSIFTLIKSSIDLSRKCAEAGRKGMGNRWKERQVPDTGEVGGDPDNNGLITGYKPDNNGLITGYDTKEEKPPTPPKEENKENPPTPIGVGGQKKGGLSFVATDAAAAATTPHKGKSLEERKGEFYNGIAAYVGRYPPDMLREFFDYWSETNRSRTKMRYELERTWELSRRLATWANRDGKYNKPNTNQNGNYNTSRQPRAGENYAERAGRLYAELEQPLIDKYGDKYGLDTDG